MFKNRIRLMPSPMQTTHNEKLNVLAIFASFRQKGISRKIVPRQFVRPNGEMHTVRHIRRTYTERVGDTLYVHFVVETGEERFFDIVFNNKKMSWLLVLELEDGNTLLQQ